MNAFGKMVELFVLAILLFLIPLYYFSIKQDMINQIYVTTQTSYLVDSARNTGFLSRQMYETYLKKLAVSGNTYDIEMTHYHRTTFEDGAVASMHYVNRYNEEILKELYDETGEERYRFTLGDYFVVRVVNQNQTQAVRIANRLLGVILPREQIQVVYGGVVRDEME